MNGVSSMLGIDGLSSAVAYIPNTIKTFLYHRYADVRLLTRAFLSMGSTTNEHEIARRVDELTQFKTVVKNAKNAFQADPNGSTFQTHVGPVLNGFNHLSETTRNILFITDREYIHTDLNIARVSQEGADVCEEIIRDIDRAILFQGVFKVTRFVYGLFGYSPAPGPAGQAPQGNRNAPAEEGIFSSIYRYLSDLIGGGGSVNQAPQAPSTVVAYNPRQIPETIGAKAAQIRTLSARYEALPEANRPELPAHMKCPVGLEAMQIPVFDQSHPGSLANRDHRHHVDFETMNDMIQRGQCCQTCRHDLSSANLWIDIQLQDEILQFLGGAVPAA